MKNQTPKAMEFLDIILYHTSDSENKHNQVLALRTLNNMFCSEFGFEVSFANKYDINKTG